MEQKIEFSIAKSGFRLAKRNATLLQGKFHSHGKKGKTQPLLISRNPVFEKRTCVQTVRKWIAIKTSAFYNRAI